MLLRIPAIIKRTHTHIYIYIYIHTYIHTYIIYDCGMQTARVKTSRFHRTDRNLMAGYKNPSPIAESLSPKSLNPPILKRNRARE